MVQTGVFWTIGKHLYIFYHPIISYQIIKVNRLERMYIGKILPTHWSQWNMKIQPSH